MTSLAVAGAIAATVGLGVRTAWTGKGDPTPASDVCVVDAALEASAIQGQLSEAQSRCLEAKTGSSVALRLLMVDTWSKGDKTAWRAYAAQEIERSRASEGVDPDLAYKVALNDSKTGEDWNSVITLAEEALEAQEVWTDLEVRERRVFNLYKLRAKAAMELWKASEDDAELEERAKAAMRDFEEIRGPE